MKQKSFILARGLVQDNSDPAGDGRLKIYIPTLDTPSFKTEDLPWAMYVSPFGGHTVDIKAGPEDEEVKGITTYGLWAVPKVGAQVLCGFTEGDPLIRFWIGCFYLPEQNHSLPAGISYADGVKTEIDETGVFGQHKVPFQERNSKEAGLDETFKHWKTRGTYNRSVSYPDKRKPSKPTTNGYKEKPTDPGNSDSQIVSLTTPGRHFFMLSDVNDESRVRFKTAMGTQIILDDTNEKIYISTARGRNYFELDEGSGKVHWYSASKLNIHAENDINLFSDENINIVAKKRVNIKSQERGVKIQAKMGIEGVSESGNIRLTASRDVVIKTTNGPTAAAVSESTTASPPPYKGKPLGVIRNWAEEPGSGTSQVKIDSYDNVEVRSNVGAVHITGKNTIDLRSISADIRLHSSGDVHIKGSSLRTAVGSTGLHTPRDPVLSNGDAGGAASAIGGSAVSPEPVVDKMIRPQHESKEWERDEDEAICKTPRNSKYKG